MIQENEYLKLHTSVLVPLNIKFDVEQFQKTMEKYQYAFRRWGETHYDKNRFGLALVNKNGDLFNNPEPTCYPLDQWNNKLPFEQRSTDLDFKTFTPVMNEECFNVLDILKPYMVRSCILKWYENSMFYTHSDTSIPSRTIRLWGTNDPLNVKLRFDKYNRRCNPADVSSNEFELVDTDIEVEAGRLYIIDTNIVHDARSFTNETYQFFFALAEESYETIENLKM